MIYHFIEPLKFCGAISERYKEHIPQKKPLKIRLY